MDVAIGILIGGVMTLGSIILMGLAYDYGLQTGRKEGQDNER